jgi:hypothetical protein
VQQPVEYKARADPHGVEDSLMALNFKIDRDN